MNWCAIKKLAGWFFLGVWKFVWYCVIATLVIGAFCGVVYLIELLWSFDSLIKHVIMPCLLVVALASLLIEFARSVRERYNQFKIECEMEGSHHV